MSRTTAGWDGNGRKPHPYAPDVLGEVGVYCRTPSKGDKSVSKRAVVPTTVLHRLPVEPGDSLAFDHVHGAPGVRIDCVDRVEKPVRDITIAVSPRKWSHTPRALVPKGILDVIGAEVGDTAVFDYPPVGETGAIVRRGAGGD